MRDASPAGASAGRPLEALAAEPCLTQVGQAALPEAAIAPLLSCLPGWAWQRQGGGRLVKRFSFANYYATVAFVNVVAAIAHGSDHHPDLSVHYGHCDVSFNTHDVVQPDGTPGGLSRNDFICAARIECAQGLTQ